MKFTSEDLMKAMGLAVGDRIKVSNSILEIVEDCGYIMCVLIGYENSINRLEHLIDINYEILPRPKRVGDLKCGEQDKITCIDCPIKSICSLCDLGCRNTLYEFLEDYKNHHKESFDQEIYDLLKTRLDKEVIE